jgi:hypothetical protein
MSTTFRPFQHLYQGLKSNINLFNSLDRIHSNLQSLTQAVDAINTGAVAASTASSGVANTITQTLTANAVITTSLVASVAALLIVILTQNATGGWTITFDTMFSNCSNQIATDPNTVSTFLFVGNGTKWVQVGLMGTGM